MVKFLEDLLFPLLLLIDKDQFLDFVSQHDVSTHASCTVNAFL